MKGNVTGARSKMDPLFEYSNILPPVIYLDDDDDDEELQIPDPARRPPTTDVKVKDGVPERSSKAANVAADADWLELFKPPPECQKVLSEDPTLLKIRKQKEELLKIWQSSEASMKDIEEFAKKGARAREEVAEEVKEAPSKRPKILLKLQGPAGDTHGFKVFVDDQFEKLFTRYAIDAKRPLAELGFYFDGQPLNPSKSPKDVDLEDEDIVEVFVKKSQ